MVAEGKPAGEDMDAQGKGDEKVEPTKSFYETPKARNIIIIVAVVMAIAALVVVYLYQRQWNRTSQLFGAIASIHGIFVYRNITYLSFNNTEIINEIPKFLIYAEVLKNKTKFAANEIKKVLEYLDKGWIPGKKHLYYFSKGKNNFDEANNECKKKKSLLAYMESANERDDLFQMGKKQSQIYWIGLSREKGMERTMWRWVTGAKLQPDFQRDWADGLKEITPSPIRHCVSQEPCESNRNDVCWISGQCDRKENWVCKIPSNPELMSQDDGLLF